MAVVGIDLGTTHSLISVFTEDGPVLIPNSLGEFLTPSAVGLSDSNDWLIGSAAKDRQITHSTQTMARFKRYMGTNKSFKIGPKYYRAEELSAMILKSLKADAEAFLGEPVERAVISVPAYFNNLQRQATYNAGTLAGINVERLINEPTAAALAYGLNNLEQESTFLVLDLGGGTFDVSILEIFEGIMEVRASAGDAFLGGEDYTNELAVLLLEKSPLNSEKMDEALKARIRDLADQAKVQLTTAHEANVRFAYKNKTTTLTVTREEFETATQSLTEKLRIPIRRAIMDAGLRASRIDRVILVGGATRMPVFRGMVTRLLKAFPEHSIDPDHVVAMGASVQGGLVGRHKALEDVVVTDVAPFTMGTNVAREVNGQLQGNWFQPVIERNTVVPCSRAVRNEAVELRQKDVQLQIYQGESPRANENIPLGTLHFQLPHNTDRIETFDIRFTYDVSGILEVLVTILSSGQVRRLVIEGNPGSLSQAEIKTRLKKLDGLKIHPSEKAENQALVSRMKKIYENQIGDIRSALTDRMAYFENILATQDPKLIEQTRQEIGSWLSELERADIF